MTGGPCDEGVPARAALREGVAALQNLHALVRSARVSSKAIAPLLPEVIALVGPLGEQLERGLASVETPAEHGAARGELVAFGRSLAAAALVALERAAARGVGAGSRLGLELELERLLPPLEGVRELASALEASLDEGPVELDLRDLLYDAFAPAGPARASWGREVPVVLVGPLPSSPARLRPRTVRALLLGVIGWVGQQPADATGNERGNQNEGGGDAVSVRLRAELVGERVVLSIERGGGPLEGGGQGVERESWPVLATAPIAPAPAALAWAASLGGVELRLASEGPAAALLVPISAPTA
ncbi:MAG: hypothetical protein MUF34_00910 [Polyangiaceae bacterium]|nr:hypothetical protein [Polyangiaceae bacterium]